MELEDVAMLGQRLNATIPADWPPGDYDRGAIEYILKQLSLDWPQKDGRLSWYAVRRVTQLEPATLVGTGGYFGPPDAHGSVEMGFSISQLWRNQGFATEMVRALLLHAAQHGAVRRVVAHALETNVASICVLQKNGFQQTVPDTPTLLRFEQVIAASALDAVPVL